MIGREFYITLFIYVNIQATQIKAQINFWHFMAKIIIRRNHANIELIN